MRAWSTLEILYGWTAARVGELRFAVTSVVETHDAVHDHRSHLLRAVRQDDTLLFAALELSRSSRLVAVNAPGGDKISKWRIGARDAEAPLTLLARLKAQAEWHCDGPIMVVSIDEAGLDGCWVHGLLEANGVQSHVVDAASIALDRRSRHAKTNRIDVEKLLRTLMGWARGKRRICAMVRPPGPTDEDARRITRERGTLITERTRHVNQINGLLATQGAFDFETLRKGRRERLVELHGWDSQHDPLLSDSV